MPSELEYSRSYYSGFPKDVIPLLRISISLFLRNYRRVKIGITNNPERRWNEHLRQDAESWDRMVVKYVTRSVNNANRIEKFLSKQSLHFIIVGQGGATCRIPIITMFTSCWEVAKERNNATFILFFLASQNVLFVSENGL